MVANANSHLDMSLKPEDITKDMVNDILELHLSGKNTLQIREVIEATETDIKQIIKAYFD